MTQSEIAARLVQMTQEYTALYIQFNQTNSVDKNLWAALHIGFMGAMKLHGYSEDLLEKALENAQKELEKYEK